MVAITPMVIAQDGRLRGHETDKLFVRGGHVGELVDMIDGAATTNPLGNDPFGASDQARNDAVNRNAPFAEVSQATVNCCGFNVEEGTNVGDRFWPSRIMNGREDLNSAIFLRNPLSGHLVQLKVGSSYLLQPTS